jgi:hypothetical protein
MNVYAVRSPDLVVYRPNELAAHLHRVHTRKYERQVPPTMSDSEASEVVDDVTSLELSPIPSMAYHQTIVNAA